MIRLRFRVKNPFHVLHDEDEERSCYDDRCEVVEWIMCYDDSESVGAKMKVDFHACSFAL